MNKDQSEILGTFDSKKVALAILLGLGVTGWLFYNQIKDSDVTNFGQYFTDLNVVWIILTFVVMFSRDFGYVYRIRQLTQEELTWKGSVYVIVLWEFASAVTPSVVGGTAVAVFLLNKEGITFGKSLAYVMLTAILDNSFFLIAAPLAFFLNPGQEFPVVDFTVPLIQLPLTLNMKYLFYASYLLILVYTLFMSFSILFAPKTFRKGIIVVVNFFYRLTAWKVLIKLRIKVKEYYDDIIIASRQLKNKSLKYWVVAIVSTAFIWSARYFTLNCVIASFTPHFSLADHYDAFSKQIILWVTQLISPTPGGSGFAEYFLKEFFGGGTLILVIAFTWRFFTYYAYLFAGSIVLPRWLKRALNR